jgi:hypothetical protein
LRASLGTEIVPRASAGEIPLRGEDRRRVPTALENVMRLGPYKVKAIPAIAALLFALAGVTSARPAMSESSER